MDIERLSKFIDKTHKVEVSESPKGLMITFVPLSEGQTTKSTVWMEPAKKTWLLKPIRYKNQYIIVDAQTKDLLDFLHTFINLDESNYQDVRRMIIHKSIKIMEDYVRRE